MLPEQSQPRNCHLRWLKDWVHHKNHKNMDILHIISMTTWTENLLMDDTKWKYYLCTTKTNLLNRVLIASRDSTRDLKWHTHKTRLVNSNIEDGEWSTPALAHISFTSTSLILPYGVTWHHMVLGLATKVVFFTDWKERFLGISRVRRHGSTMHTVHT